MTVTIREVQPAEMIQLISSGLDPTVNEEWRAALTNFTRNSALIWLGTDNDEILCFYGLVAPSILSDEAYLWMHTTPALKEHTFVLIRHSQRAVKTMLRHFPIITGHGTAGDQRSLAWLRLIGAKFGERQGPLIPFEIRSE